MNIQDLIDANHESRPNKVRFHLGASGIGRNCERQIWLEFRWALDENFPGRILRVFRRGQNEEAIVVDDLRAIGMKVSKTEDDQVFVDVGCHVGGSIDGLIEEGFEAPVLLEIKTHSTKSFDKLQQYGVRESKPVHAAQMSIYCRATGIERCLYYAVCKDDDRIYTEMFHVDMEEAEELIEKGQRLATQDEMPPPLSENPSWYECKWCNYHGFCHGDRKVEKKNCRTCRYSTAMEDGTWYCEYHHGELQENYQVQGCDKWELHDHMEKS